MPALAIENRVDNAVLYLPAAVQQLLNGCWVNQRVVYRQDKEGFNIILKAFDTGLYGGIHAQVKIGVADDSNT